MLRVLLIDDEELEYKLIQLMFRDIYKKNYKLEYVKTIAEAEAILGEQAFDMILLDDNLADGSNAIRNVPALKMITENTPLCVVSKNINAAHLRSTTILDVYDIVDKFNLRDRLESGLAA